MADAIQIFPPAFRVLDANGNPVNNAKIKFREPGPGATKTVYSDADLAVPLGHTVRTRLDGFPVVSEGSSTTTLIYVGADPYHFEVTDANDAVIFPAKDNVKGAPTLSLVTPSTPPVPVITTGSPLTLGAAHNGNLINASNTVLTFSSAPSLGNSWHVHVRNGGVSGTVELAAPDGISFQDSSFTGLDLAVGEAMSIACDGTAFRVYGHVETVTGYQGPPPQGYLTPTSGVPIIVSDVIASTIVRYTPFVGNIMPIHDGTRFVPVPFQELTLTLHSSHAANGIFDVFGFLDGASSNIGTGPAWANSGAGTGTRGAGAGTTQLTRLDGFHANAVDIILRNGTSTFNVATNRAIYLGSIFIDAVAGQVTCHRSWGQSRKWGVWNAYNRQPLYLKAGDSTASWTYTTNTIRASNGASANSLTVLSGLAEVPFDLEFAQKILASGNTDASGQTGIGFNSLTVMSGRRGMVGIGVSATPANVSGNGIARFLQVPSLGINVVTALEIAPTGSNAVTWFGGEDDMVLSAMWRG